MIVRNGYKGDNFCGGCKFYAHSEKRSGYCAHPNQPFEAYKEYVYYNFGCELAEAEKGELQSWSDYVKPLNL